MEVDRAGFEVLGLDECLRLLASSQWGRVAISVGALPAILPVRFVLDDDEILFWAGRNTALAAGTRGEVVAFQVDGDRDELGQWSVLATGLARHLEAADAHRAERAALPCWSPDATDLLVAVGPEVISGRRAIAADVAPG